MKPVSAVVIVLAASLAGVSVQAQQNQAQTPLIERKAFFGNPTRTGAGISPDGKWLSWVAPRDGVLNVYVAPIDRPNEARPLTNERARPVGNYFWAPDSSSILFTTDKGGDENFLLYAVDVATAQQRSLTPFEKTRVQVLGVSRFAKDRIVIGVNNRDPRWHDIYSLDLKTGGLTKMYENDGFGSFAVDQRLNLRGGTKPRPDGGLDTFRYADGKFTPKETIPFEDSQTTTTIGFTPDGNTLYWLDSRGRNTAGLFAEDLASGKRTLIAEDARTDLAGGIIHPDSGRVQAYLINYLKPEWKILDPSIQGDFDFLKSKLPPGFFGISGRTEADDKWLVNVSQATAASSTWLYDRKAKTLTKLFSSRPELDGKPLVEMHPVEIRTRDGLTQVSYLTLPPGSDPDGDGKPNRPVPMVLFPHGGPWGRDSYGYNGWHQFLANRGYAVLAPNFRGSTGFGKSFINAGDLQWGKKMHDDLIDAVDWAVKAGITPRDKVAIMGGSYGGYATLAGLAFTPDVFACGVDIVGPSNLNTLLSTIPPYWTAQRTQFQKRVGDLDTPEGKALLMAASPLTKADQIKRPLLIGQGANDPRVKQAESDQIVAAMQAKNIPVSYILFPDEGHGFARPENNLAFNAATEHFLARCLGGRAEPYGDALKGSSLKVVAGGSYVPGLEAAIAANQRQAAR